MDVEEISFCFNSYVGFFPKLASCLYRGGLDKSAPGTAR